MEEHASHSGVYSETELLGSAWTGQNHLLVIGITRVLSGPWISSHVCGLCTTEGESFFTVGLLLCDLGYD